METTETLAIVNALKSKSIPVCIIGELALNYYNVPWVIHVSTTKNSRVSELDVRNRDWSSALKNASSTTL